MEKKFSLTILGAGTGVPLKDRQAPGLAVQADKTFLLFDSGSGSAYQMAKAGLAYHWFDHLFYSHYAHPDHINDLAELIFANGYFDPPRNRELHIYGPKGIKGFLKKLIGLYPVLNKIKYPITVHELGKNQVMVNDIIIKSQPLIHQQNPCLGYRVEYEGKSLIYSGDTDYCESLIDLAQKGDLLVMESSFPDGYKVEGHLTPSEVGKIATQAKAKKVILTHLYPLCDKHDVVCQVKRKFSGEIVRAEDLMEVRI